MNQARPASWVWAGLDSDPAFPRAAGFGGGRAGFVLRADLREKTHQGRWRPQGPPNGLAVRPAQQPAGTGLGLGPARSRMKRRCTRFVLRDSPPIVRPLRPAELRDTPALRNGSVGGVTPRGTPAGRTGGTATAEKVRVFSVEGPAHYPPYRHRRWLLVFQTGRKKQRKAGSQRTRSRTLFQLMCPSERPEESGPTDR